MAMRPCLDCGRLSQGTRCPAHRNTIQQAKRRRRPRITWTEQQRRAKAVATHRARYGDWCPGWQCPPHASPDLTADHVTAVAAGGDEHGELQVLCRACNGRKQDR